MSRKTEVDLREIARVVASGTLSYLVVHLFLLPQLVAWGLSFATYFYIGVLTTGVLSTAISLLARPRRAPRGVEPRMHPAE